MQLEFKHPDTGEIIKVNCDSIDSDKMSRSLKLEATKEQIIDDIENVSLAAEAKALLNKLKDFTIKIGGTIVKIGMKILESLIYFIKKYPNTAIGLLVGSAIGMLVSSIPILGWLLGWLITPLCAALGLAFGFWEDMKEKNIKSSIKEHIAEVFEDLKSVPTPA